MLVLTRKDRIRIAEVFARSGFKGVSIEKSHEGKMLSAALKMKSEEIGFEREQDDLSDQRLFLARKATLGEMKDAHTLTEVLGVAGLTTRTVHIIWSRAFHSKSWKSIAGKHSMERMQVKRVYEDGLYIIYHKARLDLFYRVAA